jgi:hypothetical protein
MDWSYVLAPLIAAVQTAILMFAAYHWPTGRNEHDDECGSHSVEDHKHRREGE